jgi:hypothetical protein
LIFHFHNLPQWSKVQYSLEEKMVKEKEIDCFQTSLMRVMCLDARDARDV